MQQTQPTTRRLERASLAERLLDLADEIRAHALELLELQTADGFDARVSALLDRVIAEQEASR